MTTPMFSGTVRDDGSLALIVLDDVWKHTCFVVSDFTFSERPSYEEDGKMFSDIDCNISDVELRKDGCLIEDPTEEQMIDFKNWLRINLGKFVEDASVLARDAETIDKYREEDPQQNE